jgi:hypothetical protein
MHSQHVVVPRPAKPLAPEPGAAHGSPSGAGSGRAWCMPSVQREMGSTRPVLVSTMRTSPSRTM